MVYPGINTRNVRVEGASMPQMVSTRMSKAIATTPLLSSLSLCRADRTVRATAPIILQKRLWNYAGKPLCAGVYKPITP